MTHETAVREEKQNFSVMCKDKEKGAKVMWRGPKNRPLGMYRNSLNALLVGQKCLLLSQSVSHKWHNKRAQ